MADSDRVITFEQLPAQVQTLLKKNFAHKVPLVVTVDWDDYTVRFQSGEKAEFDKRGNWREFDCTQKEPSLLCKEPFCYPAGRASALAVLRGSTWRVEAAGPTLGRGNVPAILSSADSSR
jgi:hypothetical protein